jgi:hypothetical protein
MREVNIKNSKGKSRKFKIRSLTRKEIKDLNKYGYTYLACRPLYDTAQDAIDKALDYILNDDDQKFLDDCDLKEVQELWAELLKETYGDPKEIKNSKTITDSGLTKKE